MQSRRPPHREAAHREAAHREAAPPLDAAAPLDAAPLDAAPRFDAAPRRARHGRRHDTSTVHPLATALALASLLALAPSLHAQGDPDPPATAAAESRIERALESRTKGSADAPVVVFEIADFQCPYCARFAETVAPALDERYVETGEVQWVFVNLPLHTHPLAWHAAEAALCAGAASGQFWPMHDRLFAEQETWSSAADPGARFAAYARELGVPAREFESCTRNDQVAVLILQDLGSAVSAGITGTPTFIIMKDDQVLERMVGVQAVEEWVRVLDAALER